MSDLISRQDAIALVDRSIVPTGDAVYDNAKEDERASIKDDLLSLPSAEPKTGEWTNAGVLTVRCSNCKSEFHELEAMNYCPNCGARMYKGGNSKLGTELKDGKMNIVAEWQGELVRCKDCKHQEHCHETVAHTRLHDGFKEHWSEPIEWCSRGERKGGDDDDE